MKSLGFAAGMLLFLALHIPAYADASSDASAYNQQYQTDLMNRNIATQQQMQQQQFYQGVAGQPPGCFYYNSCREPQQSLDVRGLGALLFGFSEPQSSASEPTDSRLQSNPSLPYRHHHHFHHMHSPN